MTNMAQIKTIKTPEELKLAVEETREIIIGNGISEESFLVKDCTVESVVAEHERSGWSFEDILQDLIWESWGEDC